MELINNVNDAILMIKEHKKHPQAEYYVIEELFILKMALKYNAKFINVIYAPSLVYSNEAKEVLENLKVRSKNVYELSEKKVRSLMEKDNASGIIALVKHDYVSLENLESLPSKVMVLDGLEIPGNVGTIIRSLDACGFDLCIITNKVTSFEHHKCLSSSRGMVFKIPLLVASEEEVRSFLLNNNYDIYLGEPELGTSFEKYDYQGNVAIVVGNERYGIKESWFKEKHKRVFIPMEGEMTSLNVAISASLLAYEVKLKKEKE